MPIFARPSRALFRFSGPDATRLLFDVITARVVAEPGEARWWALLSPQGKIQAEGLVRFIDGGYLLDVDRSVADGFIKRMRMYRLRAAVEIEDLRETLVCGWSASDGDGGVADPRGAGFHLAGPAGNWPDGGTAWSSARIAGGIAELGPDFVPDSTFPHDIGMDLLGGVDFKKGCYIGQEVVSRMQHRGTARRRPVIVAGLGEAPAGSAVLAGGREAGVIGAPVDGRAVAILRLDRIADPAAATVLGPPVTLTLPPWATYSFGESGGEE